MMVKWFLQQKEKQNRSNNLIIEGDKFIYNKEISELIVIDDVKYFDNENKIYIERKNNLQWN